MRDEKKYPFFSLGELFRVKHFVSQIKCVVCAWIFFHMCKSEYKNILPENKYIFKLFYSRISFPDVKKNSVS